MKFILITDSNLRRQGKTGETKWEKYKTLYCSVCFFVDFLSPNNIQFYSKHFCGFFLQETTKAKKRRENSSSQNINTTFWFCRFSNFTTVLNSILFVCLWVHKYNCYCGCFCFILCFYYFLFIKRKREKKTVNVTE